MSTSQNTNYIPNSSHSLLRVNLNNALASMSCDYYGPTDPATISTMVINQCSRWGDSINNVLKIRNLTNDGWISLINLQTGAAIVGTDPLGIVKEFYGTTLPPRYLWVNGLTIGDASSSATALASADAVDLYTVLWNSANITGSQIWLYTSAGVITTKGADAATDFAVHKRLSLPDKRGRVSIGLDNMGGTSANVVTNAKADIISGFNGEENHTLTIAQLASHSHAENGETNLPCYLSTGGGSSNRCIVAHANEYNTSQATRLTTDSTGNNESHNNMQPWVACNFIMRY